VWSWSWITERERNRRPKKGVSSECTSNGALPNQIYHWHQRKLPQKADIPSTSPDLAAYRALAGHLLNGRGIHAVTEPVCRRRRRLLKSRHLPVVDVREDGLEHSVVSLFGALKK
jgi:hypothetical protein